MTTGTITYRRCGRTKRGSGKVIDHESKEEFIRRVRLTLPKK